MIDWVMQIAPMRSIAFTYDDVNKTYAIYVDGALASMGALSLNLANTTRNLFIGSENGTQGFFNGVIDEFRIYNRALSAGEILSQYASSN